MIMYLNQIQIQNIINSDLQEYVEPGRKIMNTETIKNRKSVRTYEEQQIPEQTMRQIREFLNQDDNPFGVPITFSILDADKDGVSSPVILGAHTYVAGKYKKQKNAEIAFGYSFEKFILYATSLGLGTVWLAATIDRKAFEKAVNLGEDEVMPAVIPLGYAAQKRSLRENLMRKGMKSDQRLPFETLFFEGDFQHPMQEENAGEWARLLAMVRLAPSATNKQPWRAVVKGNRVHFYEVKTKGYDKESTGDIQKVDLGIALCHFEIAAKEAGFNGRFMQSDPGITIAEGTEYIATYAGEIE